ncbi:MAG: hypothetical protein AAF747_02430 [Planctomycetota bacterium]
MLIVKSRRGHLVIGLTPAVLQAAIVHRGRIVASESVDIDPSNWHQAWADGLGEFDLPLSKLLRSLGVTAGTTCDVVFQSPDTTSRVTTVGTRGNAAVRAARMEMKEDRSSEDEPMAIAAMLAAVGGSHAGTPQSYVYTASDAESRLTTLMGWIARGGCRARSLLPSAAFEFIDVVDHVLAGAKRDELRTAIYLGHQRTLIAAAEGDTLRFVRAVECGIDDLADAVARAAVSKGITCDTAEAGRSAARRAVDAAGVPEPDAIVDEATGLTGTAVLPLMQPVIQRYAVEVRQTFRFALKGCDLRGHVVDALGPGVSVPGLLKRIETLAEIDMSPAGKKGERLAADDNSLRPDFAASALASRQLPSLLPASVVNLRQMSALCTGARVGAFAAAAVLAADIGLTVSTRLEAEKAARANAPVLAAMDRTEAFDTQSSELSSTLSSAVDALAGAVEDRADIAAFLAELGGVSSTARIKLTELSANTDSDGVLVSLRGLTLPGADRRTLPRYIEQVSEMTTVAGVEIDSTRMADIGGQAGVQFRILVRLRDQRPNQGES